MAGQPKTKKMLTELDALIESRGEAAGMDGEEWILDQLEQGMSGVRLAKSLGFSRQMLDKWIDLEPGRRDRVQAARRAAAEAHVDNGLVILDELASKEDGLPLTAPEVTLANSRANYRFKMAEKADPAQYGDAKGTTVNISIGDLHFQALLAHGRVAPSLPATGAPVLEAEIIEEDVIGALNA